MHESVARLRVLFSVCNERRLSDGAQTYSSLAGVFFSRGDCKSKDAKFTLKPGFYEIAAYNNCLFSLISLYKVENKKDSGVGCVGVESGDIGKCEYGIIAAIGYVALRPVADALGCQKFVGGFFLEMRKVEQ